MNRVQRHLQESQLKKTQWRVSCSQVLAEMIRPSALSSTGLVQQQWTRRSEVFPAGLSSFGQERRAPLSLFYNIRSRDPNHRDVSPSLVFLMLNSLVPRPVSQAAGAWQVWDKARTGCTHAGFTIENVWQNYFQMVSFSYSDENIYVSYKTVRYKIIFRWTSDLFDCGARDSWCHQETSSKSPAYTKPCRCWWSSLLMPVNWKCPPICFKSQ